ncbi:MAG TPA: YggS family pyridoxal phosphate-dependent enzyme [Candidatus Hydrogenedentes bacterium]|nr:YggS family pyridoxal phosphate-dependent enzyme [Candidatus Hydrogenedentota bacterium]HRT19457.1 YggS family pyridoxal phosphate-dependent enzyme [Candidatus Hydrogenedentota bacterium]HRT63809.1 YggS family pyridoxal phosphate-dependent enzyme [Candidatus Hydrogenedentota bacterium]
MDVLHDRIRMNLAAIQKRITEAANRAQRPPDSIRLIAVTKTVSLAEVRILLDLGIRDFGENRVEDARGKIEAAAAPATWHMIGSVQRRKTRDVVALFDCVDSVDRLELAEALDQRAGEAGKIMPVLVEVNVSGEETKHGFTPETIESALHRMAQLRYIQVQGLMTMAPLVDNPEIVRPVFARLRELADRFGLPERSMGMSNDFEVAVEEGATQVRIGTALFV